MRSRSTRTRHFTQQFHPAHAAHLHSPSLASFPFARKPAFFTDNAPLPSSDAHAHVDGADDNDDDDDDDAWDDEEWDEEDWDSLSSDEEGAVSKEWKLLFVCLMIAQLERRTLHVPHTLVAHDK